jgi:hypothetical protein
VYRGMSAHLTLRVPHPRMRTASARILLGPPLVPRRERDPTCTIRHLRSGAHERAKEFILAARLGAAFRSRKRFRCLASNRHRRRGVTKRDDQHRLGSSFRARPNPYVLAGCSLPTSVNQGKCHGLRSPWWPPTVVRAAEGRPPTSCWILTDDCGFRGPQHRSAASSRRRPWIASRTTGCRTRSFIPRRCARRRARR